MVGKKKKKGNKNIISRILNNEKDKRIVLDLISSWIV